MKDTQIKHIFWIENLRAIAVLAVVFLHICGSTVLSFGEISNSDWWVGNIYQSFTRFCVPVFIMLTGTLLLGKDYTLSYFLRTRLSRVLIPFIFWSLIYIIYQLIKSEELLNFLDLIRFIWAKLRHGAAYHMWYVYMIIGIYLIFPVINSWIKNSNQKEHLYFLLICLFTILINFYPFNFFKTAIELSYFSTPLGYFVLGYYLDHRDISYKKAVVFLLIFICCCILISFNTYFYSVKSNKWVSAFSPWDTLQAVSIFIFFKLSKSMNKRNKILSFISKYSYGIYLLHVLVIESIGPFFYSSSPLLSLPIYFITSIVICLVTLYIMDHLPLLNKVTK